MRSTAVLRLQRFAAGVRVLPFDAALAARYAVVRAQVERKAVRRLTSIW
jgi:predicted nucleic acid-binding protein